MPLLLAVVLAVSARAGVVAPSGPVFAPPAGAWAGPLGVAFTNPAISPFLPPGLGAPSLTSPEALRAAAPLVQSLAQALSVTPQAFAAMTPIEQKGAIELAVEDAREAVRLKAYELSETARALSRPDRAMDKEGRAQLYAAVSQLMEMREHYGPWLDADTHAAVDEGYAAVSAKAWEVRTLLLQRDAAPVVERSAKPVAALLVKPAYILAPSGSAEKLRTDMENNKSGWGQGDLDSLYTGYGFVLRQGGKHRFYSHPAFPQLHESVSRQNDLPPGYAQSALRLIRELEHLTAAQHMTAAAPATGPPATLTLADLSILLSQPKEKTPKPEPVVDSTPARAPPVVTPRIVAKTAPVVNKPQLAPSTPKIIEVKPEPPPAKTNLDIKTGLIERVKNVWGKLKGGPN